MTHTRIECSDTITPGPDVIPLTGRGSTVSVNMEPRRSKIAPSAKAVPPRPMEVSPSPAMMTLAPRGPITHQYTADSAMHTPTAARMPSSTDPVASPTATVVNAPTIISPSRPKWKIPALKANTPAVATSTKGAAERSVVARICSISPSEPRQRARPLVAGLRLSRRLRGARPLVAAAPPGT